jgi:hypothetical protein
VTTSLDKYSTMYRKKFVEEGKGVMEAGEGVSSLGSRVGLRAVGECGGGWDLTATMKTSLARVLPFRFSRITVLFIGGICA